MAEYSSNCGIIVLEIPSGGYLISIPRNNFKKQDGEICTDGEIYITVCCFMCIGIKRLFHCDFSKGGDMVQVEIYKGLNDVEKIQFFIKCLEEEMEKNRNS
jgi:hypothetical protein